MNGSRPLFIVSWQPPLNLVKEGKHLSREEVTNIVFYNLYIWACRLLC